jgi:tetratricopeptide (TPR) repeat protein
MGENVIPKKVSREKREHYLFGPRKKGEEQPASSDWPLIVFFSALAAFFLTAFIFWTIIPFIQMSSYLSHIQAGRIQKIQKTDSIFWPYTYAQRVIRYEFLKTLEEQNIDARHISLLNDGIKKMEESVAIEGWSPYQYIRLGRSMEKKVELLHDPSFYKTAEEHYKKAIALSPTRQEVVYALGLSFIRQGKPRAKEAVSLLKSALEPRIPASYFYLGLAEFNAGAETYSDSLEHLEFFLQQASKNPDTRVVQDVYEKLFYFFYGAKDQTRLLTTASSLEKLHDPREALYRQVIDSLKKDIYPVLNFEGHRLSGVRG